MTGHGTLDDPSGDEADRPRRWDDAVEWTVDSAAALWGGWKRFVRAQLRSGKKLMFWIVFAFAIAAFAFAWIAVGTASEPAKCDGMDAIIEPDCQDG